MIDFFVSLLKTVSKLFLLTAYRIASQQTKVFTFVGCFSLKCTLSSLEVPGSDCSKRKANNLWGPGALERVALLFKIYCMRGLKMSRKSIYWDRVLPHDLAVFFIPAGTAGYFIIFILRKIGNNFP